MRLLTVKATVAGRTLAAAVGAPIATHLAEASRWAQARFRRSPRISQRAPAIQRPIPTPLVVIVVLFFRRLGDGAGGWWRQHPLVRVVGGGAGRRGGAGGDHRAAAPCGMQCFFVGEVVRPRLLAGQNAADVLRAAVLGCLSVSLNPQYNPTAKL